MLQTFKQSVLFAAAILVLVGCEGKNPFDRSNDPTQNFSNLKQDSDGYKPLENTELERYKDQTLPEIQDLKNQLAAKEHELQVQQAQKANAQSSCGRVYDMEIQNAEGGRLDFIENVQKTYKVKVRSYLTDNFTLSLKKTPESSMKLSPTQNKNEWEISWQPSSGLINERESFYAGTFQVAFTPTAQTDAAKACLNAPFVQDFSVTVALDDTQPVLTIDDSNAKELTSKDDYTVVRLLIKDPAATDKLIPEVAPVKPDGAETSLPALCDAPQKTSTDKTWSVNCAVYFSPLASKITAAAQDAVLESVVAFKAVSSRTGRRTPAIPKVLKIKVIKPTIDGEPVDHHEEGYIPTPSPAPRADTANQGNVTGDAQ
jgi:hypothetical protein